MSRSTDFDMTEHSCVDNLEARYTKDGERWQCRICGKLCTLEEAAQLIVDRASKPPLQP